MGDQDVYAVVSGMKLYNRNVPYGNTDWVLCGFVSESSVFGLGNQLYQNILTTILLCALIGMAAMFVCVRQITPTGGQRSRRSARPEAVPPL